MKYSSSYWRGRWRDYCWRCALDAQNALLREQRAQARADRTCQTCGAVFTPARADGRFCSGACRQAAYRQRRTKASDVINTCAIRYEPAQES